MFDVLLFDECIMRKFYDNFMTELSYLKYYYFSNIFKILNNKSYSQTEFRHEIFHYIQAFLSYLPPFITSFSHQFCSTIKLSPKAFAKHPQPRHFVL